MLQPSRIPQPTRPGVPRQYTRERRREEPRWLEGTRASPEKPTERIPEQVAAPPDDGDTVSSLRTSPLQKFALAPPNLGRLPFESSPSQRQDRNSFTADLATLDAAGPSSTTDPFQDGQLLTAASGLRFVPLHHRFQSVRDRKPNRDSASTYDSLLQQRLAAATRNTESHDVQPSVAMASPDSQNHSAHPERRSSRVRDEGGPGQDQALQAPALPDQQLPAVDATNRAKSSTPGQSGHRVTASASISVSSQRRRNLRSMDVAQEKPGIMPYTSLVDFQSHRLPPEMTPSFMGRGDAAKEQRRVRDGWFREKARLERRAHEDGNKPKSPQLPDESFSTKPLPTIPAKRTSGSKLASEERSEERSEQQRPEAAKRATPAPSKTFAKTVWDSLKRGTGKILPRKSVANLREAKRDTQQRQGGDAEAGAEKKPVSSLPRFPFLATQRRRHAPGPASGGLHALFQHSKEPQAESEHTGNGARPSLDSTRQPTRSAKVQRSMPNLGYTRGRETGTTLPVAPRRPPRSPLPPLPPRPRAEPSGPAPPGPAGHTKQ